MQPPSPPSDPVSQNPTPPNQPGSPPNAPQPNVPSDNTPPEQQTPQQSTSFPQPNGPSLSGEPVQQSQQPSAPVSNAPMQPASVSSPPSQPEADEDEQRYQFRKNAALSLAQRKKSMKADPEEVRHVLVENEYNEEEIEYAMSKAYPEGDLPEFEHPDLKTKYGFFNKIIDVMFNPSAFFEAVRGEKSYKPAITYFVILGIAAAILQLVFQMIMGEFTSESIYMQNLTGDPATSSFDIFSLFGFVCIVALIPLSVGMLILTSFVSAAVYHVVSLIFKSKEPFLETYKAVVYAQTPSLLFSPFASIPYISLLSIIFSIWGIVLTIIGIKKLQNLTTGQAIGTVVIPLIVVGGCIVALFFLVFASILANLGMNM